MEFDIQLTATTGHVDGLSLTEQFEQQISQFGPDATITLAGEVGPNRVDVGTGVSFEIERMYKVVIPD
jgi:hypothetical protein